MTRHISTAGSFVITAILSAACNADATALCKTHAPQSAQPSVSAAPLTNACESESIMAGIAETLGQIVEFSGFYLKLHLNPERPTELSYTFRSTFTSTQVSDCTASPSYSSSHGIPGHGNYQDYIRNTADSVTASSVISNVSRWVYHTLLSGGNAAESHYTVNAR
ncbi:hypothetical protein [Teredinibacter turnerae]|uniref:hypothetical protein n=1 Tax=Teredinibacter turnerae TaxID=2426 RepID=UPI0005F83E5A|nr:hypothetical protein [Teredinibacter turnerae]